MEEHVQRMKQQFTGLQGVSRDGRVLMKEVPFPTVLSPLRLFGLSFSSQKEYKSYI